jgi:hypothetical protein
MKRLTREELRVGALMYPPVDDVRPRSRAECKEELRPCPWVACKFHLYLDVNPETGSIKINFPELEPWELTTTCSLDVAERGGITLEEVGRDHEPDPRAHPPGRGPRAAQAEDGLAVARRDRRRADPSPRPVTRPRRATDPGAA